MTSTPIGRPDGCRALRRCAAALCVLLLSACSLLPESRLGDAPGAAPRHSLYNWSVIDGGVEGGAVTGIRPLRLIRPVAVAARGNFVYIVDAGQQRLFRYDQALQTLQLLKDLSGVVSGEVTDIYVGNDLSYYLADGGGARVMHFSRDGRLLLEIQDRVVLGRPAAISVDEESGYIYIADGFNDDVLIYNPAGQFVDSIGERGDGEGRFRGITALARGPGGVYVGTRFGTARVQLMRPDGLYGSSFQLDTVTFPTAIAVDGDNRVFVSDYFDNTIKVYVDGKLVDTLGGNGSAPGKFRRITDMWLDDGLLYVADSLNGRIQVLRVEIGLVPEAAL